MVTFWFPITKGSEGKHRERVDELTFEPTPLDPNRILG